MRGSIVATSLKSRQQRNKLSVGKATNALLAPFGVRLSRLPDKQPPSFEERYSLDFEDPSLDRETRKVLNLLNYTKTSGSEYNAVAYEAGYHSISLGQRRFKGQRDPLARLSDVPFDFSGATVLDIGCNQGGMLFSVANRIKRGVGVDYDHRLINAANRVRAYNGISNLDFYHFDIEQEKLGLLRNFIVGDRVDIIFLLSVCMWIANWKEVVAKCAATAPHLLFETNGSHEQQRDQLGELERAYKTVDLIRDSSIDDPGQKRRALYLCRL